MTDETLREFILNYKPIGSKEIQRYRIDGYDFTFLVSAEKAIGGVLDMGREPQIHILENYRGQGYGIRLLEKYLIENEFVGSNNYVNYKASTEDGEKLIRSFSKRKRDFKIIEVEECEYIILKDYRFR